nr:hypothetical protein [Rhodopirellula sp. SM50]
MTTLRLSLMYGIALLAFPATSLFAGDTVSSGDYTLVKVVNQDGTIEPDLISIHPAKVVNVDGDLTVHVDLFSMARVKMTLFSADDGSVVFFLTPKSAEAFSGSAAGEIYRGRIVDKDTIRGRFSNGSTESGAFVLAKTKSVDTNVKPASK